MQTPKLNLRRTIVGSSALSALFFGPIRRAISKTCNALPSKMGAPITTDSEPGTLPAFLVCDVTVKDQTKLHEYIRASAGTLAPFGGRFHVQAGKVHVVEGSWRPSVMIIAQFPSVDHARRWYQSPAYASALAIKPFAIDRNMIICEGLA